MSADNLNRLLAPYEARTVVLSRDDIAERKRGTSFGAELNRLQGAEPNPVRKRLIDLWCLGQVTEEEFIALVGEIGRQDLFKSMDNDLTQDGR